MKNIEEIISEMTLEEKASLCSGLDFWHTKPVERLNIPAIKVSDGPHGLRCQDESQDHLGINDSVPATCFPSGATLACSWDRDLIEKVGVALGEEAQKEGVHILLGPAVNIKRSPLCGRNFEYFSEDPYLSSEIAASHINGVQSQGVGTSIKHFAVNNQEDRRMTIDAKVDERVLRETYLASFEGAIKKAKPWTVMCSYNKVNGTYASENEFLLSKILRDEWGYEGFVVSDWGAVNDRVKALKSGLELDMPGGSKVNDNKIIRAVREGELEERILDEAVKRLLTIIFKAEENRKKDATYNIEEHHQLAREVARECMVLLKNEGSILPLSDDKKIAVIGEFAKKSRFQGGGSSNVNASKVDVIFDEIRNIGKEGNVSYAQGFSIESDEIDENLFIDAINLAKDSEVAVIFAGLPERYESEGYDRKHMDMPSNQVKLIEEISKVQENIVVVLCNGAPIEMVWINKVKAVLEGYIGGQALGGAIADLLFGKVNPSGKLAETFPEKLSHNPSYLNFPGEVDEVNYSEGNFVGYKYYDKKGIKPLFPFGHGLSYTNFQYSDLILDKEEIFDKEKVIVSLKVKNIGKVKGKEVVQLYVSDKESTLIKADKELKEFTKVELNPGEEKVVKFALDKRAFAYYNVDINDYHVESGEFDILVGSSSQDIRLSKTLLVNSTTTIKKLFTMNSTVSDVLNDSKACEELGYLIEKAAAKINLDVNLLKEEDNMFNGMLMRTVVDMAGIDNIEEVEKSLDKINKPNEKEVVLG